MAKKTKTNKTQSDPAAESGQMARAIFNKVRQIKESNPAISRSVNQSEVEIKKHLMKIRVQIDKLDLHDRDLASIMVLNGLQKTAEEILANDA